MVKKTQGRSGNTLSSEVDMGGGRGGNTCTKPESVFLVRQVEDSQSHEQLEFYLTVKQSVMKSNALFDCRLQLPYFHQTSFMMKSFQTNGTR